MILDSSVAAHWFVQTEFSRPSEQYLGRKDLVAPELILLEVANALYKNVRSGKIDAERCMHGVRLLETTYRELVPNRILLPSAVDIALSNLHPIYDCLFVALALERREPLATADRRLAVLAEKLGVSVELVVAE
ncbi:type II toxin-antitoxin system VapC family toxin [Corticibacterium sp. UT-5YL-CI-8]|nr:type II toxin-antitoxin system VapC family toxin [Tianweitania sp. UT-5YL-CI-8]